MMIGNMSGFEMPSNPVELAAIRAESTQHDSFEALESDNQLLAELDHGAEILGFHGQTYFIQAHRALAIAASFEASEEVSYHNFMGLSLEGKFATFSKVHIGRLVGDHAVRAVCLTFKEALLLPFFDTLPEDSLLHVPVLAVSEISATN